MNTHAGQTQENKSQSVSNDVSQKQSSGVFTFQFLDNRSEAVSQQKLQDKINNSPQVSRQRVFKDMAGNSQQAKQAAQLQSMADNHAAQQLQTIKMKKNCTSLPDNLTTGIESLSEISLDDVKVHRNSDKPAQLQVHAYAQGIDIHLCPEQEKHLPHEAWHVVPLKQGRVKPTLQMKGKVNINDDVELDKGVNIMGEKALQLRVDSKSIMNPEDDNLHKSQVSPLNLNIFCDVIQGVFVYSFLAHEIIDANKKDDKYYEDIGFIRVINPSGGFVWADRRNVEYAKKLLDYPPNTTNTEMSEVHTFTISAPTHDRNWQLSTGYDARINCITEALDIILTTYDPSRLYILTAPEYFFAAQKTDSHFMDKDEFDCISGRLQSIASGLPSNLLMVPGTIGYSVVISEEELKSEVDQLKIKHEQLLNYVSSYKVVEKNKDNLSLYDRKSVEKEYESYWSYEIKYLGKASAKKLFNRALVFYNQTMETYEKMFESVEGETDKGKDVNGTIFEHGTAPFIREYNGIKVALQVCSDYAYESLRGLEVEPDIQLVPASNYGPTEGFQQAKALLKADSNGSMVIRMGEEGSKEAQEPDKVWALHSTEKTTLSYHSIIN